MKHESDSGDSVAPDEEYDVWLVRSEPVQLDEVGATVEEAGSVAFAPVISLGEEYLATCQALSLAAQSATLVAAHSTGQAEAATVIGVNRLIGARRSTPGLRATVVVAQTEETKQTLAAAVARAIRSRT